MQDLLAGYGSDGDSLSTDNEEATSPKRTQAMTAVNPSIAPSEPQPDYEAQRPPHPPSRGVHPHIDPNSDARPKSPPASGANYLEQNPPVVCSAEAGMPAGGDSEEDALVGECLKLWNSSTMGAGSVEDLTPIPCPSTEYGEYGRLKVICARSALLLGMKADREKAIVIGRKVRRTMEMSWCRLILL